MKTAFAAALALSLMAGTAMAAPHDTRSDQSQSRQDRSDQQGQNNRGQNNDQANNQHRGNGSQQADNDRDRHDRADNRHWDNQRGDHRGDNRRGDERRGNDRHYGNNDRGSSHHYVYNGHRHQAVRGPAWRAPRGHNAHHVWNRGDRLPYAYRDRAYVIDYRAYGLMRPAYGYQWVRVSNNVFLVNANNGFISQIVFSMFY